VLGLGHSLGMATCAEGVESKEQLAFLRSEGCTEVQGYFYSRPQPAADIAQMFKNGALKTVDGIRAKGIEKNALALLVSPESERVPAA
jgi:predicted signal transduction protein with EAL and GGDEF domain